MNKLLNRVGRSNSQQQLTNLETDENEKLTIVKLFGTKFIEKNSMVAPLAIQSPVDTNDQLTNQNNRRSSLTSI